jgi:hypothetical protein
MRRTLVIAGAVAALLAVLLPATSSAREPAVIVFNGEGNRLNAYDHATGEKQTVIWSASDPDVGDGREHRDINAQICFHEHDGATYMIAGEDTEQGDDGAPGWGWFELLGDELSELRTQQRGKLVPTYSNDTDGAENYGCGFLDDGRLLLSDVGDQRPGNGGNGQLHIWFPDAGGGFGEGFTIDGNIPQPSDVEYCKIDTSLATAGGIWVDSGDPTTAADDVVYVASARPADTPLDEWGIFRYEGLGNVTGCADSQVPLVEVEGSGVTKELFIPAGPTGATTNAIWPSDRDTLYVSSVFDGNIAEHDMDGGFIRHVAGTPGGPVPLSAPLGQVSGFVPDGTVGTPLGIGVAPDGTLYYADIGVVLAAPARPGRLMRVSFDDAGNPGLPEAVDSGLAFPDGIGVLLLTPGEGASLPTQCQNEPAKRPEGRGPRC